MQLKKPIGGSLAAATCGLLGALPSAPVVAQEAPGWEIDSSLLYYGEDDDRVTDGSLMVSARRAFDEDRSLNLDLTVDVLTGATPAGGVPANAIQTFTSPSGKDSYDVAPGVTPLDDSFLDTRVALSGNWQQALGESMRWGAGLSVSDEYDYFHLGVNGRLERDFNNRNTTVYAGAAYAQDDINPVGGAPIPLAPMLEVGNLDSKLADDSKDILDLLLGFTQVLSRRSLLEVSYSYGSSDGYLNDPYKFLTVVDPVTGTPVAGPPGSGLNLYLYESRPDSRAKQSLFAEWRHAFDRDSMAINFRIMDDDWGVTSQTRRRALPLEHQRPLVPGAAPALLHARRGGFLPHRAGPRRPVAAVRVRRLPARRHGCLHGGVQVRPAHGQGRILGAARVLPAGERSLAGLGDRRPRGLRPGAADDGYHRAVWIPVPALSSNANAASGAPRSSRWAAPASCSAKRMTSHSLGAWRATPSVKPNASTGNSAATGQAPSSKPFTRAEAGRFAWTTKPRA